MYTGPGLEGGGCPTTFVAPDPALEIVVGHMSGPV
jgi:hypothetical protein